MFLLFLLVENNVCVKCLIFHSFVSMAHLTHLSLWDSFSLHSIATDVVCLLFGHYFDIKQGRKKSY